MKIIHCSDLHLDSKMETSLSSESAKIRREEILVSFINMVEYAKETGVEVIIIAGDLFDTARDEQKRNKRRVLESIENAPSIDFLYLQGNHDKSDYFHEMDNKPDNLKLFSDEWTKYEYDNVVISGVEFSENNKSSLYSKLILDEHKVNIVTMHGQLVSSTSKSKAEIINLTALKDKNIDYLALGHIHEYRKERLDRRGMYCYSGCMEGRGFDECGDKGFVLISVDEKETANQPKLTTEFIRITMVSPNARTLHEIHVDISGCSNETGVINAIEAKIEDISRRDIVKVILEGEKNIDNEYSISYISRKLEDFFFAKICDESKVKIDYDSYEQDISLTGEFVRLVKASNLNENEKNKVIVTGIRAMLGRDVEL